MKPNKLTVISAIVLVMALVAGCSTSNTGGNSNKKITLAYVAWDSEIASTYVLKEVLEQKLDYNVELMQVDAGPMWAGISDGSADAMAAAWLPTTHESYASKYEGKYDDLGVNLDGTKIGLVVPQYMDINSIEDLTDEIGASLDYTIIGIEPGAGLMMSTEKALDVYALREKWTLLESSSAAMTQQLEKAYADQKPIVVTGWTPHWKFAKMDLKYLEDPKNVYGGDEQIHTIARKGLQVDQPEAYAFLDAFNWTPEDMADVMIQIQEGKTPEEAAKQWVEQNRDKVDAWIK
ncbi:glycine betaine/proline transport system substrate-binding protein [Paenibacillus harenae]|uniref:Glycine betaine/proline transport system substrate-binding protein n=2 Tax=Paenibacillus harenae TaxID=306543 RepID=A0ABT9TV19_PAEHA|nr:glycine betaine ABC transporter substrate-binding protein [Paenibacillus harenae]MDQ0111211.1 glycine betaine/proline transport system substrate-binding protein [Paenibacillus harenae]